MKAKTVLKPKIRDDSMQISERKLQKIEFTVPEGVDLRHVQLVNIDEKIKKSNKLLKIGLLIAKIAIRRYLGIDISEIISVLVKNA